MGQAKYAALENDDSVVSSEIRDVNIDAHRRQSRRIIRLFTLLPWLLTLVFAFLTLSLYLRQHRSNPLGTYEAGFYTDLSMFILSPFPLLPWQYS